MRRSTRIMLLAGCAFVLLLEGPRSVATFVSGWRGPYGGRVVSASAVAFHHPATRAGERVELARR